MRTGLLAATALTTTAGFLVPAAALAQSAVPFDWSGFYAGLAAGAVSSNASIAFSGISVLSIPANLQLPALGADGTVRLGYNWQSGQFVYGLESDLGIVALHGTHTGTDYTVTDQLGTLLSLRARFGAAFDRLMLFTTAGVATGNAGFESDIGKGTPASASGTVFGAVIGGGAEFAVNDNVSLTATGTYYLLSPLHGEGDAGDSSTLPSDPYSATYSPHGMVFEAGVNVHF